MSAQIQTQLQLRLPQADIFSSSPSLYITFGIEFEFEPEFLSPSSPSRYRIWIPEDWYHQGDPTAGEEIATPIMILDFSNPFRLVRSYHRARKRIWQDLTEYARRNNCLNFYLSHSGRHQSMGGHIHVGLRTGLSPETAQMIATYIKSILPLTAFLAQFDPFYSAPYSRRIYRCVQGTGYAAMLPSGRFISPSHYAVISYSAHRTIEIRIQDSAPPHVLVPIAFIYATLVASALKKGSRAPLDYLQMTESTIQYEMLHALHRRLKMAKIVIRWLALCRGDIILPKDVAFLVWLALNRIAPMDYAKEVGPRRFYRMCHFVSPSGKFYVDHFLVLLRATMRYIRDPKLHNAYRIFVDRFGRRITVHASEVLKLYLEHCNDEEERKVINAFLRGLPGLVKNKLVRKCILMAYRREWGFDLRVRRLGRGRYSREDDAQWVSEFLANFEIQMSAEEIIADRDRFYIIERDGSRIGVIRVTWRENAVRGIWLARRLTARERKYLLFALENIAEWFKNEVQRMLESGEAGYLRQ